MEAQTSNNPIIFGETPNNELIGPVSCNAVVAAATFGKDRNLELLFKSKKYEELDFQTAVILAAYQGHSNIIKYLSTCDVKLFAESGCYINRSTPLLAAIHGGQPEAFGLLLKCNPPEKLFWEGISLYAGMTIQESPYTTAITIGTVKSFQCAQLMEDRNIHLVSAKISYRKKRIWVS